MNSILMTGLIVAALTITFNAHALRCNTQIIDTGDTIQDVVEHCGEPDSYYSDVWGDKQVMTYKKDGVDYQIEVRDNNVSNVDF